VNRTFKLSRSKDRHTWVRELCSNVVSIWEDARRDGLTYAEILEHYKGPRVMSHPRWFQISASERDTVRAYFSACSDMAWRRDLVWRLGPKDGPHGDEPAPGHVNDWNGGVLSALAQTPGQLFGAHFWRGTLKPFNEYKPTN
jgi:hypothetical protein